MKRLPLLVFATLSACAPHRAVTPVSSGTKSQPGTTASSGTVNDSIPLALRWYRASAEVQAIFIETYRAATSALERSASSQSGNAWGVIMDADETVLDNSRYQQSRAARGYSADTWATWVKSQKAAALPGSVAFVQRVHELGGKVSIVTNRESALCAETEANLRAVGLIIDQVLCKPAGPDDNKNPRFAAVQNGAVPSTLPAMTVVMWLGDNIKDFPGASQQLRSSGAAAFAEVGRTWFVFPNPLYGSWERNPVP